MGNIISLICALLIIVSLGSPTQAQTITTTEKIIDYSLPYPGILPDNPLYVLKQLRDKIQLALAGNQLAKVSITVQLSDKHLSAADALAKKGKPKLSVEQVVTAEETFAKIPGMLRTEKEKAVESEWREVLETAKKANKKHREAIEELMKTIPTGQVEQLQTALELNTAISDDLTGLN